MFDIYVIENSLNGKQYVGYTSKGYEKRFAIHVKEANSGSNRYLCRAIRKYGESNFSVKLLDVADSHEEAKEKEKKYILELKTFAHAKGNHGYNATLGGDGMNGVVFPESTRLKISKSKKKAGHWVGKANPKYHKGHLISGENHPMFGKMHTAETKCKIGTSNKGRFQGLKNKSAVIERCFSLECETGEINAFKSFYEMRKYFSGLGLELNRSVTLGVMRQDYGHVTYKGFKFFRHDVTPKDVFDDIQRKYESGVREPVIIEDHRVGKNHPMAKNVDCFAEDLITGEISKFNSWLDLKDHIEHMRKKKITYSNMIKATDGRYKSTAGFRLYREDITDNVTFTAILNRFYNDSGPSTTSRKA
ncbi:GIY-YIG nuclease family protein [Paenibacillus jamilae]|uniref:GIY-YIG nuclease family protein n=1 Tax=Paenibacillus jamilae TaxID=114136 RepID=UPI003D2B2E3A